jgi:carbamoylphosphate synthase large subunit/REP element-mobilizing transposase RayT
MKSVGEAMAIGRTFKEALQKALRSLEIKRFGLLGDGADKDVDLETLRLKLAIPNAERIFYIAQAFQKGASIDEVYELTKIDKWFLRNVAQIVEEAALCSARISSARKSGFQPDSADEHLARRTANYKPANSTVRSTETVEVQFRGLDPQQPIEQRRGHLPHWEQSGATYFVTFRLADSIPADVLAQWKDERAAWLKLHPQPWDWKTAREYMRRFDEEREHWLDQGHGSCLLRESAASAIVTESLNHFDRQRYLVDAYVVMPNHVHVLFKPLGKNSLVDILHSWKSFTAQALNREMNRAGALWMHESFDTIVRDAEHLRACREYIAQNPLKARIREGAFILAMRDALIISGEQDAREPSEAGSFTSDRLRSNRNLEREMLLRAKKLGFSDRQLAVLNHVTESKIRAQRKSLGVTPTYRLVDTCAAEFEAYTPYYYSTYGDENERRESGKRKVMILGGGPNRIGQGIEFDYCCVHAAFALRELGFETIMVNSNPETVSTDYDTSDKLYFEPLTLEDVLNIYDQEKPEGVFVQFGGQTPLNLASGLKAAGVPILGTQPESIETAEDRQLFAAMLDKLGLRQTPNGSAISTEEAVAIAKKVGYPVLVRPSFVLGGRAMELVYNEGDLRRYMASAIEVTPDRPVLIDRFLEDAIEVDVDCISDGETTVIGAIMEHIEEAGIHSGDSACAIPTFSLSQKVLDEISAATKSMARELNVRGLMNVQFAVKGEDVYVLEVNPRASRTVPFVSKAIGVPLAKLAAKVMTGKSLRELGFTGEIVPKHFSVKEAVFPFLRYEGLDISLGPEMKSTGEVMGMDIDLGLAYAKSQMAAPPPLPKTGKVFVSVKDADKEAVIPVADEFVKLGFEIISTSGTAEALAKAKIKVTKVFKIHEGRPNVLDRIKNGDINFIINTPSGKIPREHEVVIRNAALAAKIPIMTTVRAALASANGIRSLQKRKVQVRSLQEYHKG